MNLQCDNLKKLIEELKNVVAKKDEADPEDIRKATNDLQQASLKLFEMAYKKVGLERFLKRSRS